MASRQREVSPGLRGYSRRMPDPPPGFEPLDAPGNFIELIGPVMASREGEEEILGLRIESRHLNAAGSAQGGVLSTLADYALGRAVRRGRDDDKGVVTVSLTTDFLGPAKPGAWVEAHTEVERIGGTLGFADCSLTVDGREVVRGRAVFAAR